MGTNYYLQVPNNQVLIIPINDFGTKAEMICVGQRLLGEQSVSLDLSKCTCGVNKLHIGKSSAGWHFALCIYPSLKIFSLKDWLNFIDEQDFKIIDEYDKEITKDELIEVITKRSSDYPLTEEEARNYGGELGLNNLIAHTSSIITFEDKKGMENLIPIITTNIRTDGTYDLTTEWDFN